MMDIGTMAMDEVFTLDPWQRLEAYDAEWFDYYPADIMPDRNVGTKWFRNQEH